MPGIHVFLSLSQTWMAGSSPAMTKLTIARSLRLPAGVSYFPK
jgi:hypothetical protein